MTNEKTIPPGCEERVVTVNQEAMMDVSHAAMVLMNRMLETGLPMQTILFGMMYATGGAMAQSRIEVRPEFQIGQYFSPLLVGFETTKEAMAKAGAKPTFTIDASRVQ